MTNDPDAPAAGRAIAERVEARLGRLVQRRDDVAARDRIVLVVLHHAPSLQRAGIMAIEGDEAGIGELRGRPQLAGTEADERYTLLAQIIARSRRNRPRAAAAGRIPPARSGSRRAPRRHRNTGTRTGYSGSRPREHRSSPLPSALLLMQKGPRVAPRPLVAQALPLPSCCSGCPATAAAA